MGLGFWRGAERRVRNAVTRCWKWQTCSEQSWDCCPKRYKAQQWCKPAALTSDQLALEKAATSISTSIWCLEEASAPHYQIFLPLWLRTERPWPILFQDLNLRLLVHRRWTGLAESDSMESDPACERKWSSLANRNHSHSFTVRTWKGVNVSDSWTWEDFEIWQISAVKYHPA